VKISLEVKGGLDYFQIVEGTRIIARVSFFFLYLFYIRCIWVWTLSYSELS